MSFDHLQGWVPNERGTQEFLATLEKPLFCNAAEHLFGDEDKDVVLYKTLARLAGKDYFLKAQGIGDCVSWGWAHGADALLATMFDLGLTGEWYEAATEPIYGGSRVEASGRERGGYSDGSYGGVAAKWVSKWGVLFRKNYGGDNDLTKYSATRAKSWGNFGCPDELEPEAKKHPIKQVALVKTFREAGKAIQNGYPVPVCSGQGFSSTRDKDGFARASGSWAHCMLFYGVRWGSRPGLLCQNSWGAFNSGGRWPDDQPDGSFWVEADVADRMLRGQDSFACSDYVGFPKRKIKWGDMWS